MKNKRLLLAATIMLGCITQNFAQEKKVLNSQDGVLVSYELTKIDEAAKKDTYVVTVRAENNNDYDLLYAVPLTKTASGEKNISLLQNKSFAQASVRNSTGLFGDNINLTGNNTNLFTENGHVLFEIKKGSYITGEKEFKVKHGIIPILTNAFLFPLKQLTEYDVALNNKSVEGEWVSSCGNTAMNLSLVSAAAGESLQQTVNGNQVIWKKVSNTRFEKSTDKNVSLTFNKITGSFTYTTTDGVVCTWDKKQ